MALFVGCSTTFMLNLLQAPKEENSPEEIVCGLSLMMAEAARSNWRVSWRFGQVAVVLGIVVAGYGVQGVLELLLLLLC